MAAGSTSSGHNMEPRAEGARRAKIRFWVFGLAPTTNPNAASMSLRTLPRGTEGRIWRIRASVCRPGSAINATSYTYHHAITSPFVMMAPRYHRFRPPILLDAWGSGSSLISQDSSLSEPRPHPSGPVPSTGPISFSDLRSSQLPLHSLLPAGSFRLGQVFPFIRSAHSLVARSAPVPQAGRAFSSRFPSSLPRCPSHCARPARLPRLVPPCHQSARPSDQNRAGSSETFGCE